jgi:preprotein translocase subunit YajC
MFIATAYAADASAASGGMSAIFSFAPLVLIVIVFYFILIRPQQQQAKNLKGRLAAIRRGDKVVTGGGFIGQVAKAVDGAEEIEVDIAPNVRVTVLRSTISTVLTETKGDANVVVAKKAGK